jgi:partner of Y14 and mago
MSSASKSGIQTSSDGTSFIPASKRADGTTRKELKVRPGYRPPEDVETYKNRSADAWKNRGKGGVPGADSDPKPLANEVKSKNAKRREAARRAAANEPMTELDVNKSLQNTSLDAEEQVEKTKENWRNPDKLLTSEAPSADAGGEAEKQKKIRNALKKLKAVRDLKAKGAMGEKLSPDQLMKVAKEDELVRDLTKLGYNGPEVSPSAASDSALENGVA